jgi:ketosteroid isomerase-like protein
MNKTLISGFTMLCIVTVILYSCNNPGNKAVFSNASETDSIKAAIHSSIAWAKNKNFSLLYNVIANDSNYLEVDPGTKIIRGFDHFRKNETFWGDPGFKAIRYEIRDLTINLSHDGNVAWFYCILDDINEWKGEPACWINTRWTGVLEKRKEKWVIVQMHFSFAKD